MEERQETGSIVVDVHTGVLEISKAHLNKSEGKRVRQKKYPSPSVMSMPNVFLQNSGT